MTKESYKYSVDTSRSEATIAAPSDDGVSPTRRGCLPSFLNKGYSQNVVVACVAFATAGMFNAMQGLGNAGGSDPKVSSSMNATLYGCFAVFGYLGGFFFNLLGPRLLLGLGALTYGLYSGGVYAWGTSPDLASFAIFAAALLGIGAGLLWTSQGAITMAYPTEGEKGQYFAVFWIIFNLGGMVGGLITFGMEFQSGEGGSVSSAAYFTFIGIMVMGSAIAFVFIAPPHDVVRKDNKKVKFEVSGDVWGELRSVAGLFMDKNMLMLTPLILFSNFMYTYEFGYVNGALFNARTRGLNSCIFWATQMFGSWVLCNFVLDAKNVKRRNRAYIGWTIAAVYNLGCWAYAAYVQYGWEAGFNYQTGQPVTVVDKDTTMLCALTGPPLANQNTSMACTADNACFDGVFYHPSACPDSPNALVGGGQLIDFTDGRWAVPGVLYMLMGISDAWIQSAVYWILGALSNSPSKLARYAGYYKGVQSLGAAVAWAIDASGTAYRTQLIINIVAAVVFIAPTYMLCSTIQEHSDDECVDIADRFEEESDLEKASPKRKQQVEI